MSVIRDVFDVIKDLSNYDEIEFLKNKPKGSLTRMTKDAVLQFPVIASRSIDIQLTQLIVKSLEKNFGSLMKIAFTLNSITDEKDLSNYIRQFHQNIGSDRDHVTNVMIDYAMKESTVRYDVRGDLTESQMVIIQDILAKDNHRLLREYLSEINLGRLNSLSEARGYNGTTPVKGSIPDEYKQPPSKPGRKISPELQKKLDAISAKIPDPKPVNPAEPKSTDTFSPNTSRSVPKTNTEAKINAIAAKLDNATKTSINTGDTSFSNSQKIAIKSAVSGKMFTDSDVKKANEIMPLAINVNVHIVDKDGKPVVSHEFIVGIKGVIHPVSSEDMVDSMVDGYGRNKTFFNFIKATTGEINFFKDFVFMVDKMKKDALSGASKNNRWFNMLKRRAMLAKSQRFLRLKTQLLPNTSIVLSAEEAEMIKAQGVDITSSKVAAALMDQYFLLAIVIVDEGLET
ncbi:MAG: hypothetical protein ACRCX2_07230, partial [Paraclostridium sp.]